MDYRAFDHERFFKLSEGYGEELNAMKIIREVMIELHKEDKEAAARVAHYLKGFADTFINKEDN